MSLTHSLSHSLTQTSSIDSNLLVFFSSGFSGLTFFLWLAISCVEGTSIDLIFYGDAMVLTFWPHWRVGVNDWLPFLSLQENPWLGWQGHCHRESHHLNHSDASCCIHSGQLRRQKVGMVGEKRETGNGMSMKLYWKRSPKGLLDKKGRQEMVKKRRKGKMGRQKSK